jgi:hypothetical protein
LDEERAAREEGLNRGVGCYIGSTTFTDSKGRTTHFPPNWYAGRVEFRTRVFEIEGEGEFGIKLLPPKWAKSNQLSRLLGSENRILVRPNGNRPGGKRSFDKTEISLFKSRKLTLLGKEYTLICPKDDVAYFIRVKGEKGEEEKQKDLVNPPPFSFLELLKLVNSPGLNDGQVSNYIRLLHYP